MMKRWMNYTYIIVAFLILLPSGGEAYYASMVVEEDTIATTAKNGKLEVHFIDVSQGDSIFVRFPNGKTMLVDGGDREAGKKVASYLKKAGVSTIDQVVATHPDIDHIGGLLKVLDEFKVKKILDSGKTHTTDTYAAYLKIIAAKEIPFHIAKERQKLKLDSDVKVQVLHVDRNEDENNPASIVLKLTYGEMDILLASDTETKNEKEMMKRYDVRSEILKVAHHGSFTSNSQAFIDKVNPEAAILSYDKNNDYGHPVSKVVARFYHLGTTLYSTAEAGDIVVTVTKQEYEIDADPYMPEFKPGPIEKETLPE